MVPTEKLRQAVSAYKNGDAQAFTLLYQESDKYIYTCIYKVMQGNDNAADMISDIMQDAYVEISKSIRQLENEDCFLQWAGMIATRKWSERSLTPASRRCRNYVSLHIIFRSRRSQRLRKNSVYRRIR